MKERRLVAVIPCSGIGKPFGTVSREVAYELCDKLRPADTTLVALSKLVLGEQDAQMRIRTHPAVTIDGCKLMCASKLVKLSGGRHLIFSIRVRKILEDTTLLKMFVD